MIHVELSLITLRYSSVSRRDQCVVRACLFNTQKTSMTFFSVMEYTIICPLTTCRVNAADLTTFPQLSLGLKAVSSTRQSYWGLVLRRSCVGCHLTTI